MRRDRLGWLGLVTVLIMLTGGAITAQAANGGNGWLGIYSQALTPELREGLDYQGDGVLVNRIVEGSPAERAGLEKGDIILGVGGTRVDSPEELADAIQSHEAGEAVSLRIIRDGERRTIEAQLTERADEDGGAPKVEQNKIKSEDVPEPDVFFEKKVEPDTERSGDLGNDDENGDENREAPRAPTYDDLRRSIKQDTHTYRLPKRGRLGIQVEDAGRDDDVDHGAKVADVLENTPAERAGLRKDDIITRVDSDRVDSSSDLIDALRGKEGRVTLEVYRRGEPRKVTATLDSPQPRIMVAPRMHSWSWSDGSTKSGSEYRSRADLEKEVSDLRREIDRLRRELEDSKR